MIDAAHNKIAVTQGHFAISGDPDDVMFCVLGSCIATCLHDPVAKIGGMNHFLLPGRDPNASGEVKYGAHAMEELINALLRNGAAKHRLQAMIFGGAKIIRSSKDIGENNARFAETYLRHEGFVVSKTDTGGSLGRSLRFRPTNGAVVSQSLQDTMSSELSRRAGQRPKHSGSIELF
jgi:chemotaxis protein CheD